MNRKPIFRPGELYAAKSCVRALFREYWKGILLRDGRVGIIQAYRGLARRVHYSDCLDLTSMTLTYIGEGRKGDQPLSSRNKALVDAANTGQLVDVFFDCGDIRLPAGGQHEFEKHFLAGGRWRVIRAEFIPADDRKVWSFKLEPENGETRAILQTIFLDANSDGFEGAVRRFAKARMVLYTTYRHIMRARDSIAGHIGEYFAVRGFNSHFPDRPLVRVRSNFPDLDAIQTGSGVRFAVKTVTSVIQKTSNIWTPLKELHRSIDWFLIMDLDPLELFPRALFKMPIHSAPRFWSPDSYQKTGKLLIDRRFRDEAEPIPCTIKAPEGEDA